MVSKLISNEDIYKEDLVRTLARFGLKDIELIWFQGFTSNDQVRFIKFINSALEKENKGLEDHTEKIIRKRFGAPLFMNIHPKFYTQNPQQKFKNFHLKQLMQWIVY